MIRAISIAGSAVAALAGLSAPYALAAEAPVLTATLSNNLEAVTLVWDGEPGPTGFFLIERSVTGSETAPREFAGIADLQAQAAEPFEYTDVDVDAAGWYCYRVRAKADDFAWSNEACVVRPVSDGPGPIDAELPVPGGLTYAQDVPRPPDSFDDHGSISWAPVTLAEPFAYVVQLSVPPRAGGEAPYLEIARVASTAEPRQIVATSPWRGPYCFRVHIRAAGREGLPSEPVCLPKRSEGAPFDITNLTAQLRESFLGIDLRWDFGSFPAEVTIERSVTGSFDSSRDWRVIAGGVQARASEGGIDFSDTPLAGPGWYCYRVKVNDDNPDVIWSEEACVGQPVVDFGPGPFPPDVGNSPAIIDEPVRVGLVVGGVLLVIVGVLNWMLFHGYLRRW